MNLGLVLTRRMGESCVFFLDDQEVEVVVEKIEGRKVHLRFIADRSVEILRSELLEK